MRFKGIPLSPPGIPAVTPSGWGMALDRTLLLGPALLKHPPLGKLPGWLFKLPNNGNVKQWFPLSWSQEYVLSRNAKCNMDILHLVTSWGFKVKYGCKNLLQYNGRILVGSLINPI